MRRDQLRPAGFAVTLKSDNRRRRYRRKAVRRPVLYEILMQPASLPHGGFIGIGPKSRALKELPFMSDLIFIALGLGLFAGLLAYTYLCERL